MREEQATVWHSSRSASRAVVLLCAGALAAQLLDVCPLRAEERAQRIAVLELASDELDDVVTGVVSDQLRKSARARGDVQVNDSRVSLEQLSLAGDCDPSQLDCLARIARALDVAQLIFGKLSHENGSSVVVLQRYDAARQTLDRSNLVSFRAHSVSAGELAATSAQLLEQLLGHSAADGGETDWHPAPATRSGSKELPRLELTLEPRDHTPVLSTRPQPVSAGPSGRTIAGYALLGGAALSVGASVFSFVQVERAGKDRELDRYRLAVGRSNTSVDDVCDEASAGKRYGLETASFRHVKSVCDTGILFEALQFVFIGTAVVSGGLAAYFLTSGSRERQKPTLGSNNFSVTPSLARRGFALGARMKF